MESPNKEFMMPKGIRYTAEFKVELFYNPKRKHGKNGMLSPVDFKRQQNVKLQGV